MKNSAVSYSNDAIRINRDNYRPAIRITRFLRFLVCILIKGESPLETRPVYIKRRHRH